MSKLIEYYKQQRDFLKQRFEAEKTGDQTLFTERSKLLKPLIESQKETSKSIQDKIATSQDTISNVLVPFTRALEKRNDQLETLQDLPYYNIQQGIEDVPQSTPQSTPQKSKTIFVDLNTRLNTTDFENLDSLEFLTPNEVREDGNINDILKRIGKENRTIGQYLGKASKQSDKEKDVFKSQKETLAKYKEIIQDIKRTKQYIVEKEGEGLKEHKFCKQKRGKGRPKIYPDTVVYKNADDLINKLNEFVIAKEAGNTGLDNTIISILDELLEKKWIYKDCYDIIYKKYF